MIGEALLALLACPDCRDELHQTEMAALECTGCGRRYAVTDDDILCLVPSESKALPPEYQDPDYLKMSAVFDESSSYFTDANPVFRAIHTSSHRTIAEWARPYIDDGWTCDLGCGRGFHGMFYEGDPSRLIGVDFRLDSLQAYRRNAPEPVLIQADLTRLPFRNEALSRIVSIYSLEHVYHLSDAVSEMARVAESGNRHFVGLPCEGGLAWGLGRKLTSERAMSRRYDLDYSKYIRLEHCNDATDIIEVLSDKFDIDQRRLFPLPFAPVISLNLTLTVSLKVVAAA